MASEVSAVVEQVYARRARAEYGAAGGEMLPVKLYEDLTRRPLRLPRSIVDQNTPHDGCNDPLGLGPFLPEPHMPVDGLVSEPEPTANFRAGGL